MNDEGVIKYSCQWRKGDPVEFEAFGVLNHWRQVFHDKQLIGENADGIGYGNISVRTSGDQFVISGTATGGIPRLGSEHYALVDSFDLDTNSLVCSGPVKASAESMSHGTVYRMSPEIKAVVHTHHMEMWEYFIDKLPTSNREVTYGTPEMAAEIQRLYEESEMPELKMMVMGGHQEGLISFGVSLEEASQVMLEYFEEWRNNRMKR